MQNNPLRGRLFPEGMERTNVRTAYITDEILQWFRSEFLDLVLVHAGLIISLGLFLGLTETVYRRVFCNDEKRATKSSTTYVRSLA